MSAFLTSQWVTMEKPLSVIKKSCTIEIGDRVEKEKPMDILALLTNQWVTFKKPLGRKKSI